MTSRWCRAAALSLLGLAGIAACGDQVEVVAPVPPEAPPAQSDPQFHSDAVESGPARDIAWPDEMTTTTDTTVPVTEAPSTTSTSLATTTTTPGTTTSTPDPPPLPPEETAEGASLSFVNARRAENGTAALELDPRLAEQAEQWALVIASDGNLRHNPDMGSNVFSLGYDRAGENVGYAGSAADIDQGWWESQDHRRNILNDDFDAIGIAFVVDEDGTYWGVQVFGGR